MMNKKLVISTLSMAMMLAGCNGSSSDPEVVEETPAPNSGSETPVIEKDQTQSWFAAGNDTVEMNKALINSLASAPTTAKNIILFVGDGMGVSTVTSARIRAGQLAGTTGEENTLSFENASNFPFSGLSKTYTTDFQTPDSAGTMSAMMTGVKTRSGVINVAETVEKGDCSATAGNELISAMVLAEVAGKSTGVISTARLTHATPAATYAVSPSRSYENEIYPDSSSTTPVAGCGDIAYQMVNFGGILDSSKLVGSSKTLASRMDGLEVMLGGGKRHFVTENGRRRDNRNLINEWQGAGDDSWKFVENQRDLNDINASNTEKLLGFFNDSHMSYEADREGTGEPSLSEMTGKALDVLSTNDNGFFLMVEAGRIDHAHHAGNAYRALHETIALSDAIQTTIDKLEETGELENTLIIVTADHGHTLTMAGYPKRGNPILGKSVNISDEQNLDKEGKPYTTLGYINGSGFGFSEGDTAIDSLEIDRSLGRKDISEIDTEAKNFFQEALVNTGSETHTAEDVAIYARGPMAEKLQGTLEQNVIFHVMNQAGQLQTQAQAVIDNL